MKQKSWMKRCNRYGGGVFLAALLLSLPVAAYAGLSEHRMPAIVGEHASPGRLQPPDVVIVLDPEQMAVVTAAVPQ